MTEIPSLSEFLTLIAGGGFAGVVVSFLLEHIGAFQKLAPEAKKWIVLAIYVVLPLAATALLQFVPPDVLALLEPYWHALAVGFVGWTVSQLVYDREKRRNGG